jgi:excisionase family DNA binding protein
MAKQHGPAAVNGQGVPDRLLKVDEAAAMLGLTPATLYQWAYERRIPVVKPNGPRGPLRFRLSTLQRLIAEWERPALGTPRAPLTGD